MPRLVFLSDTHNANREIAVPDGDILIHAGDATNRGTIDEIILFNDWFSRQPHRHKIFVAGNHDWLFETNPTLARKIFDRAIYLQDGFVEIENLKIYGSPWQPRFFDWAFNLNRGRELAEKWNLISHDVDILVTHGPPFGILDETPRGDLAGCEELRKRVEKIASHGNLKLHVFGHIHAAYGATEKFGVKFINASNCDEDYLPTNPPIVIDL
jgi:Icc-related predicted phosphoesterase